MLRKLASTVLIELFASAVPVVLSASERQQLPAQVRPVSYDLSLVPDAANLRFRGQVRIALDIKAATPSIVLNDDELTLDKAVLDTTTAPSGIALDPKLQRATLRFEDSIGAGSHTLTIEYHGVIGKATIGFFAMDYDSPPGTRRTIATNFEPTGEGASCRPGMSRVSKQLSGLPSMFRPIAWPSPTCLWPPPRRCRTE
jgi:aminopeptidase N